MNLRTHNDMNLSRPELIQQYNRCLETVARLAKDRTRLIDALKEAKVALEVRECETCNGSKVFKFECPGCLSGEGECTCDKQEYEPCPQCQSSDEIKAFYQQRDDALAAIDKALEGVK